MLSHLTSIKTRLKVVVSAKLGRCPYCMRWAILGTVGSWTGVALLLLIWRNPAALLLALGAATSFTLVTVAHLIALTARVAGATPGDLGRRELLGMLVKVGGAVFATAVWGGLFPERARAWIATQSPCTRLCNALFPPGPARSECRRLGAQGHGPCFEGFCVPQSPGFKEKTDQQTKIQRLIERAAVPSALAGAFFRMARRFALGRPPDSDLEARAFSAFEKLSPAAAAVLGCSVQRLDALHQQDRERLVGEEFADDSDEPVRLETLAPLVATQLVQTAAALSEQVCLEEVPGKPRLIELNIVDGGEKGFEPLIFRLNGLRGAGFRPRLSPGDLTPDEVQRECTVDLGGQVDCATLLSPNCPGGPAGRAIDGVCLRVPEVLAGDTIFLEGANFIDVAARVRLTAVPPGVVVRLVEATVCGDQETPVTETVGGQEVVIADSRVKDRLSFTVPEDLPDGLYHLTVIVPNNTGHPEARRPEYESVLHEAPVIRLVTASPSSVFQVASEELLCIDETNPEFLGSDEVGIRIIVTRVGRDFMPQEIQADRDIHTFRFDELDDGNRRRMDRVLFQGSDIGALSMLIIGFEVDGEDEFKKTIDEFAETFVVVTTDIWNELIKAAGFGATVFAAAQKIGLPTWAAAIAGALAAAIQFFIALWAPPDPLIEDVVGFTVADLAALTSVNFPAPSPRGPTESPVLGIKVTVQPCDPGPDTPECPGDAKVPFQYRERRIYDPDDGTYQITLRYNRLS